MSPPPCPSLEAEAGAFVHGQAPRRSRGQLAQWAAQVGDALLIASEGTPPIAAIAAIRVEVLGSLRTLRACGPSWFFKKERQ